MATVYMTKVLTGTFKANADLSSKQYYFVEMDASGDVGACNAATDIPIGVLLNKPDASGKAAEVGIIGIYPVNANGALNEQDLIGPAADGQADGKTAGSDTTEYVVGQVIGTGTAAGDLVMAAINCATPHRAA